MYVTANAHVSFKKSTICKEMYIVHKNSTTVSLPHLLWGIYRAVTCFLKFLQITQLQYVDHFSNRLKPAHKYSPEQDARFEVVQGFLSCGPHSYLSASDSRIQWI